MKQADSYRVKIIARQPNGEGNVLLTLAAQDEAPLPCFTPGAHIDVTIPALGKRQYSLCSPATHNDRYAICVRLDQASSGGSRWLHHQVNQGDELIISAPRNHFPLPEAERYLLFAAGIGLTPLLPMAEALAARGKPFVLHLYLKGPEQIAFSDRLAAKGLAENLVFHFSDRGDSLRQGAPDDLRQAENSVLVACGPDGFMTHLRDLSQRLGWQAEQFYSERFKPSAPPETRNNDGFMVELASSGVRLSVGKGESIAEVLMREGIAIDLSCEQGMCGACITGVLAGTPEHRDEVLSPREKAANDQIVLCCSRSRSPILVLDL